MIRKAKILQPGRIGDLEMTNNNQPESPEKSINDEGVISKIEARNFKKGVFFFYIHSYAGNTFTWDSEETYSETSNLFIQTQSFKTLNPHIEFGDFAYKLQTINGNESLLALRVCGNIVDVLTELIVRR